MTRNIVLLHGRAPKPEKHKLQALWFDALRGGLRSTKPELIANLEACSQSMIYYGDLSNQFLESPYVELEPRRRLLDYLEIADFDEYCGEITYDIETPADDILAYWNRESQFSQDLRQRIAQGLDRILQTGKPTILFAHSLGAVLIYDALCELNSLDLALTLVSMGSPLTHPHFEARATGNIPILEAWHNVSARGDKICGPKPHGQVTQEHEVINPLIKDGEPDPHHALGYLRHPQTARVLADWLTLS